MIGQDNLQQTLDKRAKQTRAMVSECVEFADHYCRSGDFVASAQAWDLAATYCKAMAKGRALNVGEIRPMAGDK